MLGLVGRKLLCNHSLPSPSVPCSFLSPGFQDSMKWASVSGRDLWNHEPKTNLSSLRLLLWGICHRWRGWETQKMDSEKWGCCDYLSMWLLIPWNGLVGGIWESQEKQGQKKKKILGCSKWKTKQKKQKNFGGVSRDKNAERSMDSNSCAWKVCSGNEGSGVSTIGN